MQRGQGTVQDWAKAGAPRGGGDRATAPNELLRTFAYVINKKWGW